MNKKILLTFGLLPIAIVSLINKKTSEVNGLFGIDYSMDMDEYTVYEIEKTQDHEEKSLYGKIVAERNKDSTIKTLSELMINPLTNEIDTRRKVDYIYDESKRVIEQYNYINLFYNGLFLEGKTTYTYDDSKKEASALFQSYDSNTDTYNPSTLEVRSYDNKNQLLSNVGYRYIDEKSKQIEDATSYTYYSNGLIKSQEEIKYSEGTFGHKDVFEYEYDQKGRETLFLNTHYSSNKIDVSSREKRETVYDGDSYVTILKSQESPTSDFRIKGKYESICLDGKTIDESIYYSSDDGETFEMRERCIITTEYDDQNRLVFSRGEFVYELGESTDTTYIRETTIKYHDFTLDLIDDEETIDIEKSNGIALAVIFSVILVLFYAFVTMFFIWRHQIKKVVKGDVDNRKLHVFDAIFKPFGSKIYAKYKELENKEE